MVRLQFKIGQYRTQSNHLGLLVILYTFSLLLLLLILSLLNQIALGFSVSIKYGDRKDVSKGDRINLAYV